MGPIFPTVSKLYSLPKGGHARKFLFVTLWWIKHSPCPQGALSPSIKCEIHGPRHTASPGPTQQAAQAVTLPLELVFSVTLDPIPLPVHLQNTPNPPASPPCPRRHRSLCSAASLLPLPARPLCTPFKTWCLHGDPSLASPPVLRALLAQLLGPSLPPAPLPPSRGRDCPCPPAGRTHTPWPLPKAGFLSLHLAGRRLLQPTSHSHTLQPPQPPTPHPPRHKSQPLPPSQSALTPVCSSDPSHHLERELPERQVSVPSIAVPPAPCCIQSALNECCNE